MKDKIEEFIKRRFPVDCNWLNGNCYHFAVILNNVFGLPIAYLPVDGHFVVIEILNNKTYYYDFEGCHELNCCNIFYLDKIKEEDPNWYNILLRDCIQ